MEVTLREPSRSSTSVRIHQEADNEGEVFSCHDAEGLNVEFSEDSKPEGRGKSSRRRHTRDSKSGRGGNKFWGRRAQDSQIRARGWKIAIAIVAFVCIVGLSTLAAFKGRSNKSANGKNAVQMQDDDHSPLTENEENTSDPVDTGCYIGVVKDSHETLLELDLSGISKLAVTGEEREGYLFAVIEGYNKVSQGCDDEFERWMYGAEIINQTLVKNDGDNNSPHLLMDIASRISCDACPTNLAFASKYPTNGAQRGLYHVSHPSSTTRQRSTRSRINIKTRGSDRSFKTPNRLLDESLDAEIVLNEIENILFQEFQDYGFEGVASATVHPDDGLPLVLRNDEGTSSTSDKTSSKSKAKTGKSGDECGGKGKGKGKSKSSSKSTTTSTSTTSTTTSTTMSSSSKGKSKGKTDAPSSSSQPSMSSAPSCSLEPSSEPSLSSEPSSLPSVSTSPTLSMVPSISTEPSIVPSSMPSISVQPSRSFVPSESSMPTDSKSKGKGGKGGKSKTRRA